MPGGELERPPLRAERHSGWLTKRPFSGKRGSAKRRYLILFDDRLQWFASQTAKATPLGELRLTAYSVSEAAFGPTAWLYVSDKTHQLQLTGSADEIAQWEAALEEAIGGHRQEAAETKMRSLVVTQLTCSTSGSSSSWKKDSSAKAQTW